MELTIQLIKQVLINSKKKKSKSKTTLEIELIQAYFCQLGFYFNTLSAMVFSNGVLFTDICQASSKQTSPYNKS